MTPISDSNTDYVTLLNKELKTCCMPQVTDAKNASTEDIVRDLHRVLTGNGNVTEGMIFKMAATSVNVKLLKVDVGQIEQKVDNQEKKCQEFQTAHSVKIAAEAADKRFVKRVGKAIWENKALIFVLLLTSLVYFNNLIARAENNVAVKKTVDKRINELLDAKIDKLVVGKVLSPKKD